MGIFALLQNLGGVLSRLGDLRKCSWLQLVILSSTTIGAAATTYQVKQDWIEAPTVGLGTFVAQLPHIYAPAPGTISFPDNHPLTAAVSAAAARDSAIKAAKETTRGTPNKYDVFGNH